MPTFAADLFAGTAHDYARYRVPYPQALIDDLVSRSNITGQGDLLDLGCGPGRVSLPLAPHFRAVQAIDQEPDMIAVGREQAAQRKLLNMHFSVGRAEDFNAPPASFELITIGEAFHRFDQSLIAKRALQWLRPGCYLATMGCYGITRGDAPWQQLVREIVHKWCDREPATPVAKLPPDAIPFKDVLQTAGFGNFARYTFLQPHTWTPDSIIGNLYSTSVCSKRVLGNKVAAFEEEMRRRLLTLDRRGRYDEVVDFGFTLAQRPAGGPD